MTTPGVAVVTSLSTTPVKGLRIQRRDAVELDRVGACCNRRFYLVDERGKMVNGKIIGPLAAVVSEYDPHSDSLTMAFPDGDVVTATVSLGPSIETRFFSQSPMAQLVIGPWSEAVSAHAGRALRLVRADPRRSAIDRGPQGGVSLISRASLRRLEGLADQSVDARRFRMLVEVEGPSAHEEDGWVGRRVRIGPTLVAMHGHVGRCLVTSRDPDSGEVDLPTLDLLRTYRGDLPTTEPLAFGIFGEVLEPGPVRVGDEVSLA